MHYTLQYLHKVGSHHHHHLLHHPQVFCPVHTILNFTYQYQTIYKPCQTTTHAQLHNTHLSPDYIQCPNTALPCTEEHHSGFYNLTSLYSYLSPSILSITNIQSQTRGMDFIHTRITIQIAWHPIKSTIPLIMHPF